MEKESRGKQSLKNCCSFWKIIWWLTIFSRMWLLKLSRGKPCVLFSIFSISFKNFYWITSYTYLVTLLWVIHKFYFILVWCKQQSVSIGFGTRRVFSISFNVLKLWCWYAHFASSQYSLFLFTFVLFFFLFILLRYEIKTFSFVISPSFHLCSPGN